MTACDHFWTAAEAIIAAALATDPERTRALVCPGAVTPEQRAEENVRVISAAVEKHPGASGRALPDLARAEARTAFGRGLGAAEYSQGITAALERGWIRREGHRATGYAYTAWRGNDAPSERVAEAVAP